MEGRSVTKRYCCRGSRILTSFRKLVPDGLAAQIDKHRDRVNQSAVFAEAIRKDVATLELKTDLGDIGAAIERLLATKPGATIDLATRRPGPVLEEKTEPTDLLAEGAQGVLKSQYGPSKWLNNRQECGRPDSE
jgi:hypothetical protein